MILKHIAMVLAEVMYADDKYFPLTDRDMSRLLEHVPDGEEIFLTLRDNLYTEYVRAENQCGTIVVHRAQGDSVARKFPRGTCLFFEPSVPVIEWLICNHNCCEGDCECEDVALSRIILPTGLAGQPWQGRLVFTGTTPINYSLTDTPDWVTVEYNERIIHLYGTPPAAGSVNMSVAATNCQGSSQVVRALSFQVVAAS